MPAAKKKTTAKLGNKNKAVKKTALNKPGNPQTKGSVERKTKAANQIPEAVVRAPKGKPITVSDRATKQTPPPAA